MTSESVAACIDKAAENVLSWGPFHFLRDGDADADDVIWEKRDSGGDPDKVAVIQRSADAEEVTREV